MKSQKISINGKSVIPTEEQEQAFLVEWLDFHPTLRDYYFHIPNGGKRSIMEGARFKKIGVKPGIPDIAIMLPRGIYHGAFVELKRRNGVLNENQKTWLVRLAKAGYAVMVCFGADDAIDFITEYWLMGESRFEKEKEFVAG